MSIVDVFTSIVNVLMLPVELLMLRVEVLGLQVELLMLRVEVFCLIALITYHNGDIIAHCGATISPLWLLIRFASSICSYGSARFIFAYSVALVSVPVQCSFCALARMSATRLAGEGCVLKNAGVEPPFDDILTKNSAKPSAL